MKIAAFTMSLLALRIIAIILLLAAAALIVSVFITDGPGAGLRAVGLLCLIVVANNVDMVREAFRRHKATP